MRHPLIVRILPLVFVLMSAAACSDETDVEVEKRPDISTALIGTWYTDDEPLGLYAEHTYAAGNVVSVSEYRQMYGYRRVHMTGSYEVNDATVSRTLTSEAGLPTTESVSVDSLSTLYFRTVSADYGVARYYRIVGTLDMQAGTTSQLDVLRSLVPITGQVHEVRSYKVKDESVASVDESGLLTAKRRGTTYVLADTPSGVAVVKVAVSDQENLWDDFSCVLGKSLEAVKQAYGPYCAYASDESLQYVFDDYYVESMSAFVDAESHLVDSVVVMLNETTEPEVATEYLSSRMTEVKDKNLPYAWFVDHPNYLYATYAVRYQKEERCLVLTSYDPDWDVREYDFGLTFQELKSKYGNAYVKRGNLVAFDLKGDFIEEINYFFTDDKVSEYNFYINRRVPKAMVEDYINSRYHYYSFYDPTVKNIVINGEEKLVTVSYNSQYHSLRFKLKDNHNAY